MPGGSNLLKLRAPQAGVYLETSVIGSTLQHSKSARWDSQAIMNRSSGVLNYSGSDNESVGFTIGFYAQRDALAEVINPINALRALAFPVRPGVIPPSVCYLDFSDVFHNWACVVQQVSVTYPDDIWDPSGHPMSARVSINLTEVDIQNRAASDVGSGTALSPF